MKKFIFVLLVIFGAATLNMSHLNAAPPIEARYHYAFHLSCGTTIYRSFSQELTSEDILTYYDLFEYKYCGKESEKKIQE